MISPPRQHGLCFSTVFSASASIAYLLHRARMPWILEHPCGSWLWDVPKIQTRAAPRTAWQILCFWIRTQKTNVVSAWECGWQRLAPYCASCDRTLQCVWTKTCSSKGFRITLREIFSRDHTRPPRLSIALPMILTMDARLFQRTHPLSGMGSSLNASNDIGMGVTDLELTCKNRTSGGRNAYCSGWLAELALACLTWALVARTDLPTHATLAAHDSHSLKKMMIASCRFIISAESCHIANF